MTMSNSTFSASPEPEPTPKPAKKATGKKKKKAPDAPVEDAPSVDAEAPSDVASDGEE